MILMLYDIKFIFIKGDLNLTYKIGMHCASKNEIPFVIISNKHNVCTVLWRYKLFMTDIKYFSKHIIIIFQ